ncbi:DNA-binding protein [Bacteroidia bacterium]|nr:DNA-binding protein [Bacteroidia bacterium]
MENNESRQEEVFSKAVRAGKRTYFMDVKAMKSGEQYLTITESKRKFIDEQGKFIYEKHKIFVYPEDFEKFVKGLTQTINFINTGELPPVEVDENSADNEYETFERTE